MARKLQEELDEDDPLYDIKRMDAFFDGDVEGDVPIEVLREQGLDIPDEATLDDEALHAKLWEILRALPGIGMVIEDTDHLSDRELYRWLVTDALVEETCLPTDLNGVWHVSPIGGCSEEDNEIYLRYYADEETREHWRKDFGEPIPPKEVPPYDRDRLLPVPQFLAIQEEN